MGVVYESIDREKNQRVALKTLRNARPDDIYRFKREFRSLRDLQHTNLVSLGELVEYKGVWFFTMELVDGVDLLTYVRRGGAQQKQIEPCGFDEARMRNSFSQLVRGLAALHEAGKVHRDIKPKNILVTEGDRVVLLDFGLLLDLARGRESTDVNVVGTAAYMAPEQAVGDPVEAAADWYAVGVMLYEALTGRLPHQGSPLEIVLDKQSAIPPSPRSLNPRVPEDLDSLCQQLLRATPSERPGATEVLAALGADGPIRRQRPCAEEASQRTLFVGREEELGRLQEAYENALGGDPVAVIVAGESGIGKSALIARFTAGLADSDAVIFVGRCNEHELVPFKAFDGVVDALSRHMRRLSEVDASSLVPRNASLLPRVFPVLGRVDAIANAPRRRWEIEDPVQVRSRAFVALRDLLFRIAERSSVVVVIDDFQWVDTDSMMLLSQLLQPPDAPPLLLLASWRTTISRVGDLPEAATRALASGGDLRFLALGSLASRDARELARSIIERVGAAQGADPVEIAREARGHPLYIDAIVRYAATGERGDAPLQLDEAIWARVLRLPRPARRLMEFVAVSGEPVSRETLRHAAKQTGAELDKLLSVLRAEHLVRTIGQDGSTLVEAYHDRAREAVLAHLTANTCARLHGRLAVSLTVMSSEEPQAMVEHWLGAGDRARAGLCAVRAGKRAERAMAYGRAADHYELALELLQLDADRRRELLTRLGDARAGAGRLSAAAEAYLAAAADAPRDTSLELRRHATEQYLRAGRLEEGRILCEQLLAEIGLELPRSSARAIASIIWSRLKLRVSGRHFHAKPSEQVSSDDLRFMAVCWSVMSSLNIAAPLLAGAVQQWYALRALRAGDPEHAAHAASGEAGFLATGGVGRRAICEKRMLEARALVETAGTPRARGFHAIMRAMVSFMLGDFETCAAAGEESYRIYTNDVVGARYEAGQACNWWLAGLLYCGKPRLLADNLGVLLREAEMLGDEYLLSSLRSWRSNFVWLARDQPDEARRQASRCPNRPSASGEFHTYHYYRWHTDAQIALYVGDTDAARELLDRWWRSFEGSLVHRVQSIRIEINFLRARCAIAAAEQRSGDAAILAEARGVVRAIDREGASWGRGLAALAGAGLAMQRGDRAAALANLERAEERSANCHMRLFEQLARLRRGQLTGGREGEVLVGSATEWMRSEEIVAPEAIATLYAPGFGRL